MLSPAAIVTHPPLSSAKGQMTRAAILDAALELASQKGLEGLSIGMVADRMHMSKSGVFAHFGSREELQICVIREYHRRFRAEVFEPALKQPRGLPRLRRMFESWVARVSLEREQGCIYISGAVEFDDRPGAVRDALEAMVRDWQSALERSIAQAVQEGHLAALDDAQQLLFEMHGLILALHHDAKFLRMPGAVDRALHAFSQLLARHAARPKARRSVTLAASSN